MHFCSLKFISLFVKSSHWLGLQNMPTAPLQRGKTSATSPLVCHGWQSILSGDVILVGVWFRYFYSHHFGPIFS